MDHSRATSALLQFLIRANGFVRSCQGETHWATLICELIGNMRRSDGSALQSTVLLQCIHDRLKDQDLARIDDPPSLLFNSFQHMVHEKGKIAGEQLVCEFGITGQETLTCTCGHCDTGEDKLTMLLKLMEVKIARDLILVSAACIQIEAVNQLNEKVVELIFLQ